MESITITLTRSNDARGIVDLGFTADWLRKNVTEIVWTEKDGVTEHKLSEDFEITAITTESRTEEG